MTAIYRGNLPTYDVGFAEGTGLMTKQPLINTFAVKLMKAG